MLQPARPGAALGRSRPGERGRRREAQQEISALRGRLPPPQGEARVRAQVSLETMGLTFQRQPLTWLVQRMQRMREQLLALVVALVQVSLPC